MAAFLKVSLQRWHVPTEGCSLIARLHQCVSQLHRAVERVLNGSGGTRPGVTFPVGQTLGQTASFRGKLRRKPGAWAKRVQPANSKGGNWWQSPLCGAHTDRPSNRKCVV